MGSRTFSPRIVRLPNVSSTGGQLLVRVIRRNRRVIPALRRQFPTKAGEVTPELWDNVTEATCTRFQICGSVYEPALRECSETGIGRVKARTRISKQTSSNQFPTIVLFSMHSPTVQPRTSLNQYCVSGAGGFGGFKVHNCSISTMKEKHIAK